MTTPFLFQVSAIVIATFLLLHVFHVTATSTDEEDTSMAYLRDENGERMLNGGTYYIVRRINRKDAGGLTVVPNTNTQLGQGSACPLYITQEKDANSNGIPVKIVSSHINSKYLPFGTTDFTFVGVNTECTEPLVWRLHTDSATGHNYVAAGTNQSNIPSAFFILIPFNYVESSLYEINFCDRSVCGRASFLGQNGLMGIDRAIDVAFLFRKAFNQSSSLFNSVI
ncbi:endogenous alpha-amylase/subtilisin inhibitor-like [Amaranthus tricolor]|uniref:endogenous alpha-amylase/subtilisin inhibitor-like n=1 Tax=Amaranthus tricolor TaxID=29722 RepID=UPI002586BA25|nr:endogenous alpha-amylase/subtilisin inhibitor-like [Amaranthus tricolor]